MNKSEGCGFTSVCAQLSRFDFRVKENRTLVKISIVVGVFFLAALVAQRCVVALRKRQETTGSPSPLIRRIASGKTWLEQAFDDLGLSKEDFTEIKPADYPDGKYPTGIDKILFFNSTAATIMVNYQLPNGEWAAEACLILQHGNTVSYSNILAQEIKTLDEIRERLIRRVYQVTEWQPEDDENKSIQAAVENLGHEWNSFRCFHLSQAFDVSYLDNNKLVTHVMKGLYQTFGNRLVLKIKVNGQRGYVLGLPNREMLMMIEGGVVRFYQMTGERMSPEAAKKRAKES